MAFGDLSVDSQSLELTPSLRSGIIAITIIAFVSFIGTTLLFSYLTYKLIWHLYVKKPPGGAHEADHPKSFQRAVDFALGIDGIFDDHNGDNQGKPVDSQPGSSGEASGLKRHQRNPPNQFLVLIINLLLADMHQGTAFFLNTEWLRYGTIRVNTATCFAQGLFVSTGDLAASCFITAIAAHTYLSVVRRTMVPHKALYAAIVGIWLFVYIISTVPIAATQNGASSGGFFVRAGAWCWIGIDYDNIRLLTHYLWIFIGLASTLLLYLSIFVHLRLQARSAAASDERGSNATATAMSQLQLSHNPAFLIYPIIYILCTLPLALGRISSMVGKDPPLGYMCFSGAMISCSGIFDCLLFGTTRNVIVFAGKNEVDRADVGLNTFAFMQTPSARRYGNMVWVQGGGGSRAKATEDNTAGGWWSLDSWQRLGGGTDKPAGLRGHRRTGSRSVSQESLRGPTAIQMDTVTTVVVELEQDRERDLRDSSARESPSVNSTENEFPRAM